MFSSFWKDFISSAALLKVSQMKVLDKKGECSLVQTSVYYLLKIKNGEGRQDHIKILGQANFIRIQIKRKTAILTKCVILQERLQS